MKLKGNILKSLLAVALLFMVLQAGCSSAVKKPPLSAIETGIGLTEITDPNQFPDFRDDGGKIMLLYAIDNSREYFKRTESYPDSFKSIGFTPEKQIETLNLFRDGYVGSKSPQDLSEFIAKNFRVFQAIGNENSGTVQFAGYGFAAFGDDVKRKWDHTVYNSSIGLPAVPMRSIAAKEGAFPLGGLAFAVIETGENTGKSFFVLNQDNRRAVDDTVRADVFFGIGKEAIHKAENFNATGKLYYLLKR